MANLYLAGSAFVRLIWTSQNGTVQMINVLGSAVGSVTFGQTLANNLDTAIKSAFASSGFNSHVHPSTSLQAVGVRDWRTPNQVEYVGTGAPVVGTATGDLLPSSTALCFTFRTALAGSRYRGRIYLGGFGETDNTATGQSGATLQTTGLAFVGAVHAAMSAQNLTPAVISRPADATDTTVVKHNPAAGDQTRTHHTASRPGAVSPITGIQLRNGIWDSQRRRGSGGSQSTLLRAIHTLSYENGIPEVQSGSRR